MGINQDAILINPVLYESETHFLQGNRSSFSNSIPNTDQSSKSIHYEVVHFSSQPQ